MPFPSLPKIESSNHPRAVGAERLGLVAAEAAAIAAPGSRECEVLDLAWQEALRSFLVDLRGRGYSLLTLRDYQGDVERLRRVAAVAPAELTGEAVAAALETWRTEGVAPSVLRRKRSALRGFLSFLGRSPERICSAAELWRRAAGEPAEDRLLIGLVTAAGARLPELCAVEGRDLKVRARVVRLRAGLRLVPMHPALAALLEELRHETPWAPFRPVLGGRHGFPVNVRTMHARFRRLVTRLGVPDLNPDHLRREVAAHLVGLRTPQGLVSAFLARDRGRPVAPRNGALADLTCLAERLASFPLPSAGGGDPLRLSGAAAE
jgi:site-specific recombinase XerC